ncbi:uncharacterized protein F5891DRAFT_1225182 [Suillus fuscotomentosus]|uniref:Uncharacterized protein n=1 Tax=Suillus fuscotomentosus TaxID=1912939 RepID=A0AAD4E981_9AGAM|nr:uncharacterized protein F5891DRAFT_1225182 [Suillus fuscotomentosus]KAG1900739.1 hypothetical protein F5891DRAFT_1225182 [Suillus fuscotomentosus]
MAFVDKPHGGNFIKLICQGTSSNSIFKTASLYRRSLIVSVAIIATFLPRLTNCAERQPALKRLEGDGDLKRLSGGRVHGFCPAITDQKVPYATLRHNPAILFLIVPPRIYVIISTFVHCFLSESSIGTGSVEDLHRIGAWKLKDDSKNTPSAFWTRSIEIADCYDDGRLDKDMDVCLLFSGLFSANDPSETLNPSAWTGPEPIIICATSLAHASLMLHLVPVLESNGSYTSSPLLYSTPTLSNPMSYRKALVVTVQPLITDQVASLREKHVNVDCMSSLRTVDDSWDESWKATALVVTAQPLIANQVASLREKHVNVDCMSFLRTVDDSWDIMRHLRSQQKPDICYITPEKLRESNAMQDILA